MLSAPSAGAAFSATVRGRRRMEGVTSAWERETRPAQPCVAGGEPPDRVVDLPELEDVHVAFGSSALCEACAQLALAGEDGRLAQRAATGWQDDPEVAPDLVKLLMAWAGHRMPPGPATPEPHRHVEPRPLSAEDADTWRRRDLLMVDGPAHRVSVHGHISHTAGGETSVFEAFRDGDRSRVVGEDGRVWAISDGATTWRMSDDGMVASPYDGETWAGQGLELTSRRTREDMDVFGFATPIGPIEATTCLGRPAWSFRFAAPAHKPFDMAVVVDDETGLVLGGALRRSLCRPMDKLRHVCGHARRLVHLDRSDTLVGGHSRRARARARAGHDGPRSVVRRQRHASTAATSGRNRSRHLARLARRGQLRGVLRCWSHLRLACPASA